MADSNKTERATPRRRQKAREKGQVTRSRDLISGLATLAGVLAVAARLPDFPAQWRQLLRHSLEAAATQSATPLLIGGGSTLVLSTAAILGLSWGAALLGAFGQGGLVLAPAALAPSLSRLSPGARMRQLFSLPAFGKLLKSLLPAAAIVAIAVAVLRAIGEICWRCRIAMSAPWRGSPGRYI